MTHKGEDDPRFDDAFIYSIALPNYFKFIKSIRPGTVFEHEGQLLTPNQMIKIGESYGKDKSPSAVDRWIDFMIKFGEIMSNDKEWTGMLQSTIEQLKDHKGAVGESGDPSR